MAIGLDELGLAARNHGMPLEMLREPITPLGLHYLLIHFDIPELPDWALDVGGRTFTLAELRARERLTVPVTLECAGNGRALLAGAAPSQPWLSEAIGTAEWTGTPLAPLLRETGLADGAVEIVFTGADRGVQGGVEHAYARSLPLAEALRAAARAWLGRAMATTTQIWIATSIRRRSPGGEITPRSRSSASPPMLSASSAAVALMTACAIPGVGSVGTRRSTLNQVRISSRKAKKSRLRRNTVLSRSPRPMTARQARRSVRSGSAATNDTRHANMQAANRTQPGRANPPRARSSLPGKRHLLYRGPNAKQTLASFGRLP